MLNNRFPCQGHLTEIRYFRGNPDVTAYVGIWRQVSQADYILKYQIPLPAAPIGIYRVPVSPAIMVDRGDFLGVHYDRDATSGVIASSIPEDGVIPQSEMFQTQNVELYYGDVQENQQIQLSRFPNELSRKTYALQAIMDYDFDGESRKVKG